ncbi:hypothetical protein KCU98_g11505, partial [Aureobasidium melanogenum]
QWYDYLAQATDQTPKTIRYSHNTRQALSQAGFTDISERVIKAPYRAWSTDPTAFNIGNFHQTALDLCFGLEALSLGPFSRVFGWSKQEIEAFLGCPCMDGKKTTCEMKRQLANYHFACG